MKPARLNKWPERILYGIALTAAAVVLCLPLLPSILVTQSATGKQLWASVDPAPGFTIGFTHSANKGYVTESYSLLPGGGFTLATGTFESYGAGMLDQLPEGVTMEAAGDHMLLRFPPQEMTELTMIPGEIAGHTLTCGQNTVKLSALSPYHRVTIRRQRLSLLAALWLYRR